MKSCEFCLSCLLKFTTVPHKSMRATLAGVGNPGTPGSPANLNTFVCNSISLRFAAATHVVHFADPSLFRSCFFCLPSLSLVFLTPIYANLLGIVLDASRWGVGMPSGGKLSWSRTLRSAACLIDCAIEARGRRGKAKARREFISPPKVEPAGRPFSFVFLFGQI